MNAKQVTIVSLIAVASAFASVAAQADDVTIDSTPFAATKSRAQVQAEVLNARAQGTLFAAGEFAPIATLTASTTTRDAVRSAVRAANAKHELLPAGEVVSYAARNSSTRSN